MKISRKPRNNPAKKVILFLIGSVMVLVGVYALVAVFMDPEAAVPRKIEFLARDYYESYFYDNFKDNLSSSNVDSVFEKHVEIGFSPVALRQLLLFENGKHSEEREYLEKYCDTNRTTVVIYPEAPFNKNNYHVKYNLSCQFE